MNRSRFALILLFASLLASCQKQIAEDIFKDRLGVPLPKGARCSEYSTDERQYDQVFAVQFQDVAQSKAFLANWRLVTGPSAGGENFKMLAAIISKTKFEEDLVKGGWTMSSIVYDDFVSKIKPARNSMCI